MSSNFVQNATLRSLGLGAYRIYAQAQFWRSGPKVMINSIPKAGTHLLTTYLKHAPYLMDAHLHLKRWDAYRLLPGAAVESWQDIELNSEKFSRTLESVRNGQIITGHLYYLAAANELLNQKGFKVVNLVRNPRDMLVSRLHYILGLKRHHLHNALTSQYADNKQRLIALIAGPPPGLDDVGGTFRPYRTMLEGFVGWNDAPGVLTLRYEDLVGERGGGSTATQSQSLERFFAHIGRPMAQADITALVAEGATKKSATLRKGKIGDWHETFDDDVEAQFQQSMGHIMTALGY